MNGWLNLLKRDPLPRLANSENRAIAYFSKRDLLDERVDPIEVLWELTPVRANRRKQFQAVIRAVRALARTLTST